LILIYGGRNVRDNVVHPKLESVQTEKARRFLRSVMYCSYDVGIKRHLSIIHDDPTLILSMLQTTDGPLQDGKMWDLKPKEWKTELRLKCEII